METRLLGQQGVPVRAVDAATRREHEPAHAVKIARVDQDLRGGVVQVDRLFGIQVACRIADNRGEGHDGVDAAHGLAEIATAADVPADDLEAGMPHSPNTGATVVEPIQDADLIPTVEEHAGQM